MNPLIPFYKNEQPDYKGRFINDIFLKDNFWLEYTHDYIQWLFPNIEPSEHNPKAPLITEEVIDAFNHSALMQQQLQKALTMMLSFYGLQINGDIIQPAENWNERKTTWFTRRNHNALRISRIMKCLATLGRIDQVIMLYNAIVILVNSERVCSISRQSLLLWHDVASGVYSR